MSLFDGRNRANVTKLQRRCPRHPDYRGQGERDPSCHTCEHLAIARRELTEAVTELLEMVNG